jgi:hypothetical protein
MTNRRFIPLGFLFAGVLMLAAALVPLIKGRPFNLSTGVLGGVFLVMATVTWRQGGAGSRPDA